MENFERTLRSGTPFEEHHGERETERDFYFRAIVQSRLLDTLQTGLVDAGFEKEQIDAVAADLAALPQEDQKRVLAIPLEIRGKLFATYENKIASGAMTPQEMLADLLEKNKRYGYTIGFHLSDHKIPKKETREGVTWDILGSELDDRDDRLMAYYSEDYAHRYKKKGANYLYVVRSEVGPQSAHRQDLNNHWGRAPKLSVIDEFEMDGVERAIDEAMRKEVATHAGDDLSTELNSGESAR
jgi:hypothetical protein